MSRLPAALAAALLFSAPAFAELNPQEVGKIQEEQKAAVDQVRAKHGNKSDKDLTPEERNEQGVEEQKAALSVLQKHGVSDKEFSRYSAQMDHEQQAQAAEARKQAEQKRAAAKADPPKASGGVVEVDRGGEDNGTSTENGVQVDRGVPVSQLDGNGAQQEEAPKAAARSKRGGGSHPSHGSRSHHAKGGHRHHR